MNTFNTYEFDKIFYAISYYVHSDEKVIIDLILNEKQLIHFEKELNLNLLNSHSTEQKENIIKYYLFELIQLQQHFKKFGIKKLQDYRNTELTDYEKYLGLSYYYFDSLLNEIQLGCGKYNIDFWHLCKTISFDCSIFDNGTTTYFNELKNEEANTSLKNKKDPTTQLWFNVGLLFAKGEISLEIRNHLATNFSDLARAKGNIYYRTYIEGTIKDYQKNNTDKNIFYKTKKPQDIINYCLENEIPISEQFQNKFKLIKSKL